MKIIIFILIINLISYALASTYRININRNIKFKRKAMEMAWKMKSSVEVINSYIREIAFILIFILGMFLLVLVFNDFNFLNISTEGTLVGNIGLFIATTLALGTVVFMVWGGVSQGIFKVDVYSQFKVMNHLRRKKESKIFTEFVRPTIRTLIEGYLYFYLLVEILRVEGIQREWVIYSIGILVFTLYKMMIYSDKNQRILIGSWYFCIGVFGHMLLGVHANLITVFFYLMVADAIWVYKG